MIRRNLLAVAVLLALSGCVTSDPGGGPGAREGRNLQTPSGGLVPGQWPQ